MVFDASRYQPPLEALVERARKLRHGEILGIDGDLGAGKTHLARWLAEQIEFEVMELDERLPGDGNWYRCETVRQEVVELRSRNLPLLVEGVCLLELLPRGEFTLFVFLRRETSEEGNGRLHRKVQQYFLAHSPMDQADIILNIN